MTGFNGFFFKYCSSSDIIILFHCDSKVIAIVVDVQLSKFSTHQLIVIYV